MKVIVIGSSGSGKTTFATRLAEACHFPILHLDSLWHKTDYSQEAKAWFLNEQTQFMQGENWIIDGNYRGTLQKRLHQADVIIWLKVSKPIAIFRVLRRSVLFRIDRKNRKEMPDQFHEKLDRDYWEFLKFVWNYDEDTLREMIQTYRKPKSKLIILKSKKQKETYLKNKEVVSEAFSFKK